MTVSLDLNSEVGKILQTYAEMCGMTVSEICKKFVLERVEDEFDLKALDDALEEYRKNPVSYSLKDVIKELDLE